MLFGIIIYLPPSNLSSGSQAINQRHTVASTIIKIGGNKNSVNVINISEFKLEIGNLMREDIREKFGKPVKRFLTKRYGTLKYACERLSLNPSLLSQYISGTKKPNAKFHHIMQQIGFDMSLFTFVEGTFEIDKTDGVLSYDEMKFLYLELKELLREKNDIIKIYERRISEYRSKLG